MPGSSMLSKHSLQALICASAQIRLADLGVQGPGEGQDQQHGPNGAGMQVLRKLGDAGRPGSASGPGPLHPLQDSRCLLCSCVASPSISCNSGSRRIRTAAGGRS